MKHITTECLKAKIHNSEHERDEFTRLANEQIAKFMAEANQTVAAFNGQIKAYELLLDELDAEPAEAEAVADGGAV